MVSRTADLFARPWLKGPRAKVIGGIALLLALALVALLVTKPWASIRPVADPAPGDRVLQTVNVSLQGDGSLSTVGDTIVIARAQGGSTETTSASYDPSAVVNQVPARVLTAYRAGDKSGTNLADLKGYNGRVTIDLTVENLTVKPQQVSYDVAGQSRTTTALVGAPLTVVASAALAKTDASKIITAANTSAGGDATNGVVSRSSDNDVQVQWATILAPPQLAATATLRLVVDAKDFTLPTLDLSVQPGLITDPSVGALVDAAFNPASSDELALQTRTIALVGDVNSVIGRASDTITRVRKTLSTTSSTLGTKTVNTLKSETTSIGNALKSSNSDIKSLGKDLDDSLKAANSATLTSLAKTVDELDQVLGDTDTAPVQPKITGSGCDAQVAAPGKGGSVYASVARVTGQLEAYAKTTATCRDALKRTILTSLGPDDTTKDCVTTSAKASVTCSLADISASLGAIAQRLIDASEGALVKLDPTNLNPVLESLRVLIAGIGRIIVATGSLFEEGTENSPSLVDVEDDLKKALLAIDDEDDTLAGRSLREAIDNQAASVTALAREVRTSADDLESTEPGDMRDQNDALAQEICDLAASGQLTPENAAKLRSYLSAEACTGGAPLTLPPPYTSPLGTRIHDRAVELRSRAGSLEAVAASLDTRSSDSEVGAALTALSGHINKALAALNSDNSSLVARAKQLRASLSGTVADIREIEAATEDAQVAYTSATNGVNAALAKAKADAEKAARDAAQPAITRVIEAKKTNADDVDVAFAKSISGLNNAADQISKDAKDTIGSKRDDLQQSVEDAKDSLDDNAKGALSRVADDVNGATRDLDATRTMLDRDLKNILADLGNPKGKTGVLGLLGTSASAAGSADFQLSLASDKVSGYQSVRTEDLNGIRLRQAQAEAALKRQAELPAFVRPLPSTTEHTTIYLFHLA